MEINKALLEMKVSEYGKNLEAYKAYTTFLIEVLKRACERLVPGAMADGRTKTIASFAEKVVRKQDSYRDNPEYDITDRSGARVMTQNSQDRDLLCDYVRKNFLEDKGNSVDVKTRLRVDQFGYLSVHYIVQLDPTRNELEGVPYPKGVTTGKEKGFKAELQVRTMLEHVWANSLHDRLYKVAIKVPEPLKRDGAGLAAAVENADQRLQSLSGEIDSYLGYFSAYLSRGTLADEVAIVRAAREFEKDPKDRAKLTLRLGRLLRHEGKLDEAIAEWNTTCEERTPSRPEIRMELGSALCWAHRENLKSPDFKRGQEALKEVAETKPGPKETETPSEGLLRAAAAHHLAWSKSREEGKENEARGWFREALKREPSNPYHLAAFLGYEVFCTRSHESILMMRQAVELAIDVCRKHVAVGIEKPRAYFTMGRLRLLLGDDSDALSCFVEGIRVVLAPEAPQMPGILEEEKRFVERVNIGREFSARHETLRRLFELASAVEKARAEQPFDLEELKSEGATWLEAKKSKTALLVIGGAGGMPIKEVDTYEKVVQQALESCEGIVCSGGTNVGVPGLVGKAAERLKATRKFGLIGYVPGKFERGVLADEERYDKIISTGQEESNEREPIQAWIDLLAAGIRPENVRALGINGGPIAAFEYRLALALGARVGVIPESGREAEELFRDLDWRDHPNLIPLPATLLDEGTMRAFVRPAILQIDWKKLEELAQKVHEAYLKSIPYSDVDEVRQKYGKLREDLKESNRQQILYATEILASEGYALRGMERGGAANIPLFSPEEIERMAKKEHGRWNIERLSSGWRYGPKKDVKKKLNPNLTTWDQLSDGPEGMKRFDRDAISGYAELLAEAGFEIIKK